MRKIKKAIIPAAGLGTRFLPATKAMPKEMLPIVDKPTIQYIIEEAVESGIEDIIIVTGKGKRAIEDHFDKAYELEDKLLENGEFTLLEKVQYPSNIANLHYIRQKDPLGLGHAILCARSFIGDEPFAVLLGDDIVQAQTPCIKQIIDIFLELGESVIGVSEVSFDEVSRYGNVDAIKINEKTYEVKNLIEKPSRDEAPSNLAIIGRYILTPEIFSLLNTQEIGAGGEIQLTDAIQKLNQTQKVFAYQFEGTRYDVGEPLGFIKTQIEMGLKRPEIRDSLQEFIREIITDQKEIIKV